MPVSLKKRKKKKPKTLKQNKILPSPRNKKSFRQRTSSEIGIYVWVWVHVCTWIYAHIHVPKFKPRFLVPQVPSHFSPFSDSVPSGQQDSICLTQFLFWCELGEEWERWGHISMYFCAAPPPQLGKIFTCLDLSIFLTQWVTGQYLQCEWILTHVSLRYWSKINLAAWRHFLPGTQLETISDSGTLLTRSGKLRCV